MADECTLFGELFPPAQERSGFSRFLNGVSASRGPRGCLHSHAGAEICKNAGFAVRRTCLADRAAVLDDEMAQGYPMLLGEYCRQIVLDLHRIDVPSEPQPAGNPSHMGVDHHSNGLSKPAAENDVGRFATDARKRNKFVHAARHLSAVLGIQFLAAATNVFRLRAEEACAVDNGLDLGLRCVCHGLGSGPAVEEVGRHRVDAFVGALSRENRGDEELKRTFEIEGAAGVGIG